MHSSQRRHRHPRLTDTPRTNSGALVRIRTSQSNLTMLLQMRSAGFEKSELRPVVTTMPLTGRGACSRWLKDDARLRTRQMSASGSSEIRPKDSMWGTSVETN